MKETTQHYYVEVNEPDLLEVGQTITDDDNAIIGFVYDAFNGRAEVMLWKPIEIEFEDHMENISASVEDVYGSLAVAMVRTTEDIRQYWKDVLQNEN